MKYYNKYLKYKNKYLKLKGGTLTSELNLTGPSIIGYFDNRINKKKKIILMGDIHNSYDGACEHKFTITEYIDELSKDSTIIYDLFIESDFTKKERGGTPIINDYISELINYGLQNYKQIPNIRIHFHDIRDLIPGFFDFINFNDPVNFFLELEKININDEIQLSSIKNFIEFFIGMNGEYNNFLFNFLEKKDDIIIYTLNKELFKLKNENENENEEYYNKLIELTNIKIIKYKKSIEALTEIINFETFSKLINEAYLNGQIASACISDLYLIARIMKNDEYNNNIIYAGYTHYSIIEEYLENINYVKIKHIEATESEQRCINNILHFPTFFNNSTYDIL
jgi:hypothetical protein